MVFNQLNVLPTPDTLAYLSSVMSGSPLDLDLSTFKVEIITSHDAIEAEPDRRYKASTLNFRVWYDAYLQQSSLILSLQSLDLTARAMELCRQGVLRAWANYYNPHLTVRSNMPPMSNHYKRFVVSVANVLGSNERLLEFGNEYVTQVDLSAPIDADYNEAMFNERQGRRNF